jgi:hypothetical protein
VRARVGSWWPATHTYTLDADTGTGQNSTERNLTRPWRTSLVLPRLSPWRAQPVRRRPSAACQQAPRPAASLLWRAAHRTQRARRPGPQTARLQCHWESPSPRARSAQAVRPQPRSWLQGLKLHQCGTRRRRGGRSGAGAGARACTWRALLATSPRRWWGAPAAPASPPRCVRSYGLANFFKFHTVSRRPGLPNAGFADRFGRCGRICGCVVTGFAFTICFCKCGACHKLNACALP